MVMRMVLFITLLTHSFTAYSQVGTVYPVEINAMLTPPYGTCLTDYVGTNRFQCNVLMRDMRATGYKFRILMTVKDMASGRVMFAAQSDQHTITPGMPTYMAETGVFGEFFKPENILSSTAYRDGCMNEGAYNFVFQIVDDRDSRRIPISKECLFPARLDAGGAPFLTSPFTGTNIDCNQTIVNLTWQMPFVTGEQIQYLVEVCPSDEGGTGLQYLNDNIRTNYYYSATTYMPMHVLQKTEMMLRENTTYFWRVSILDKDGNVKRNSSSEIDSFSYCYTKELEPYVPLKEPKVKAINGKLDTVHIDTVKTEDNSTKAYWILDEVRFKYQSYALDVRKKSQDTWTSYYIEIKEGDPEEKNYYGLSNLKYNELYEARMQYLLITDGDTAYAPYSDTITFKVPNPMDTADCGEIMPIKDCDGEKGKILKKYDTLYANGTPVVLDSIIYKAEDSTVISGFGIVAFPIVQNFKLKMKFNEVSVNCYGELVSGQVASVYNESTGAIVDLNRLFGKGDGGGSQSSNEKPEVTKYDSKDDAAKNMPTGGYAQVGDSIYTKDKDGNLVNVGSPLEIPADKYTNDNGLDDDDVYCIFRNDTKDAPYIGFDADEKNIYRKVASLSDHYQSFSKQAGSDNEYIIPYVASNPGRVVKLSATLEGRLTQEYNMDSVKFIMPLSGGNYLSLNAKKENDKFIVDFPGGQNPDTNCDVYAIVKKGDKYVNVGKINIETYAWRKQKVKFVPVVNDYDVNINAVSETLNRIYGRFGITYEVIKDEKFEMIDIDKGFVDNFSIGSGLLSNQSSDMKRLQGYYKKKRDFNDSTAYIYLLKTAKEDAKIDGDMPQGQICGYIFMHSDNGTLSDGRLVAHELAHGIYKLDHVFEKAYGITEKTTDNLLDYNNGDQLAHFQWELIKHPGFAWAIFDKDEDSMGESTSIFNWLKDNNSLKTDDFEAKIEDNMSLYDYVNENSHSEKRYYLINGTISLEGDYNYLSAQNSFSQKNENDEVVHKDNMEILSDIHNEEEVTLSDFKKNNVYCIRTTPKFDDSDEVGKKLSNYFAMMHIYSFVDNPVLSNYKISKLSDLKNNKRVRAGYRTSGEHYGLIAFYDESGNLQVVLQLYSPNLGVDKISIEAWVEYLLLKEGIGSTPNENTEPNIKRHTDHYIVYTTDANERDSTESTHYAPKSNLIPRGLEVTILETITHSYKVKKETKTITVCKIKDVNDANKIYWTSKSNLKEIKYYDDSEKKTKKFASDAKSYKLPYKVEDSDLNTPSPTAGDECLTIAICGSFERVIYDKFTETSDSNNSEGYWINKTAFEHDLSEDIQTALTSVASYLGTTYDQQTDERLRTENTEAALEYMDCTEFMARFVGAVKDLNPTYSAATYELSKYAKYDECYKDYFCFVPGSGDPDFRDIKPGDMFIWRKESVGHVGVVESYTRHATDKSQDKVTILEAVTIASSQSLCSKLCASRTKKVGKNTETTYYYCDPDNCGNPSSLGDGCPSECSDPINKRVVCQDQVRRSVYLRDCGALTQHKGWIGYFRLIDNE